MLMTVFMLLPIFSGTIVWAEKNCGGVETTLLECEETGSGAVGRLILDVIDILSIGIGILGVIGISVVGIQYLTAGGNEQKTAQAKKRMLEIVIGLVVYALLFGIFQWFGATSNEETVTESNTVSDNSSGNSTTNKKSNTSSSGNKKSSTTKKSEKNGASANGKKLMSTAQSLAEKMASMGFSYYNGHKNKNWSQAKSKKQLNCAEYVSIALQEAGLSPKNKTFYIVSGQIHSSSGWTKSAMKKYKDGKVYKVTTGIKKSISQLVKEGKVVPGDIVGSGTSSPHTMIFREKKNGKFYFYSVNTNKHKKFTVNMITKRTYPGSWKVGVIIHLK